MYKQFIGLWLLLLALPLLTHAQQYEQQADQVFDFMVAQQGDSVYVRLSKSVQEKTHPDMFSETFGQLEKLLGKYQAKGEWEVNTINDVDIYTTDVQFEHQLWRFLLSFDARGEITGIQYFPAPQANATPPMTLDPDKTEEQPIEITSGKYKLPGTLTLPKGQTHVPVVILVHGSGPSDRDETLGTHKPFRDLAWGLSEHGIATIRCDTRTVVYEQPYVDEPENYDTEVVDDVLSVIKWAKDNSVLNKEQIYIVGHSLGGTLAPRIAERSGEELGGIVIFAGASRPLEDLIVEQTEYLTSITGSSQATRQQIEEAKRQAQNVKNIGTDLYDESIPLFGVSPEYWDFSNKYKPVEVAKKLKLPVLILQGERDYQVTLHDYGLWRVSLFRNPNVLFKSYPKVNHMFQEGNGPANPMEYYTAGPVASYIIQDIADWIHDKGGLNREGGY